MNDRFKAILLFSLITLIFITERPDLHAVGDAAVPAEESLLSADPVRSEQVFVGIAKKITPAVVNISTTGGKVQGHSSLDSGDSFFKRFFGETPTRGRETQERSQSMGSGVIVAPSGYIVTNHHVIDKGKEIRVTLNDRREFLAKLVGSDPKSDIAVIKIDAKDLHSAPWGDSSVLQVGEYALAIGNAFGLTETVTLGIISAVGRANVGISDYEDFIQTDAPINPGNSGGPLINIHGELIGVNTAIFSQTGGSLGIGFAIPSNMAKPVMESLIKTGRVVRGWLGLSVQEMTPDLAGEFGLPKPEGVLVGDLLPDSPAEKSGLRRGDIILFADGKGVESTGHFRNMVASSPVGSPLKMKVVREGRPQDVVATIQEQPREARPTEEETATPSAEEELSKPSSGIEIEDVTPENRKEFDLPGNLKGVVIREVESGSSGEAAGLRRGDIILEVNRKPAGNATASKEAISKMKKEKPVLLLINRGGRTLFLTVKPN